MFRICVAYTSTSLFFTASLRIGLPYVIYSDKSSIYPVNCQCQPCTVEP